MPPVIDPSASSRLRRLQTLPDEVDMGPSDVAIAISEVVWRVIREAFSIGNSRSTSTVSLYACDLNNPAAPADHPWLKVISSTRKAVSTFV